MANTGLHNVELRCQAQAVRPTSPSTRPAELTEIPDDDQVQEALQNATPPSIKQVARPRQIFQNSPQSLRIAIWGDSHMAAAFFSDQLVRRLSPAPPPISSRFIHAGIGHAGVRSLVRKTCLSGEWRREMAYAHADAASAPGPGMTSLVSKKMGATLAVDLRDVHGQARHNSLQLLYHGDETTQTQLAIRIDDEVETEITLYKQAGPHALNLQTPHAISSLQIRVIDGQLRFQGIQLPQVSSGEGLHLDVLAYPGATVAAWARSDLNYLASWFTTQTYDLALIAFGTNEGNDPHFNEAAYRDLLFRAVGNFRQVFPQTQCILIAPGDRGIRVTKSQKIQVAKNQTPKASALKRDKRATSPLRAKALPAVNLLKYARIHAVIGQIQSDVAAQHGCMAWSMQSSMGGIGSAYSWARKSPPLMSSDLIHFTSNGYREMANSFLVDFGLSKP